jgi:hypothetical protein
MGLLLSFDSALGDRYRNSATRERLMGRILETHLDLHGSNRYAIQ